jgi:hypothetical protein
MPKYAFPGSIPGRRGELSVVPPQSGAPVKPRILLIQPPFTQLNSPYPGIFYLRTFLERRGYIVSVRDHSIGLFEKIFCPAGLARIFADAKAQGGSVPVEAGLAPIIERFLSEEERWLASIDRLTAFLRGRDREWGHLLTLANGVLPGGPRFDACLEELCAAKGEAGADDGPLLASALLADIAGFINAALDGGFSLIRYVPSIPAAPFAGFHDFAVAAAGTKGYIMDSFYRPLLEDEWSRHDEADPGGRANSAGEPLLLGLGIPFPGCLAGALTCAESAKAHFGESVITVAGGGYINTELRFVEDERVFDYFDCLSFDRAYGSLDAILSKERNGAALYKTMYRDRRGTIVRDESINGEGGDGTTVDDEAARTVFPDYRGLDFSRYICPVDDRNPMHRLWSDGRWLKAYAAHGCYWQNCAFCDVSLDYIRCFKPVDPEALFCHLTSQAAATGVRGVHLVDEACPPVALLRLALLNRAAGLPLVFWGNIRFERAFSPDAAAILAAGGLIGVSAGIEVATEKGFARIGKGLGLNEVSASCAAFKEAGILVHAYLIYGYWDEDDQEIVDSAETLRQLFAQGLLDSAFWHQFVLTRHSRIYAEKSAGLHPQLRPVFPRAPGTENGKIFALNDLSFAGEERFARWSGPLDGLLGAWMRGETSRGPGGAFPFKTPGPSVPPDLVAGLLDGYARSRDRDRESLPQAKGRALFLGSRPVPRLRDRDAELCWRWRLEEQRLRIPGPGHRERAAQTAALLEAAAHGTGCAAAELFGALEALFAGGTKGVWKKLRSTGLALF